MVIFGVCFLISGFIPIEDFWLVYTIIIVISGIASASIVILPVQIICIDIILSVNVCLFVDICLPIVIIYRRVSVGIGRVSFLIPVTIVVSLIDISTFIGIQVIPFIAGGHTTFT